MDRAAGVPNYFEKDPHFTYKRIGIFDNKGEDVTSHLEVASSFIEHSKHHGNILVHCIRGVSRSASFVIGYLMKYNEMTLDEALTHVQSRRPVVLPNESFMAQLKKYEVYLQAERVEKQKMEEKFSASVGFRRPAEIIGAAMGPGPSIMTSMVQVEVSGPPELPSCAPCPVILSECSETLGVDSESANELVDEDAGDGTNKATDRLQLDLPDGTQDEHQSKRMRVE